MIKIEVTGDSIAEVADKLLALGANLRGSAIVEAGRAVVNAMAAVKPAEEINPKPRKPATKPAEKAAEEIIPEEVGKAAETPSAPAEPAATMNAPAAPSDAPVDADALKALVLSVVKLKGRDTMVAILEQFGVAKATDVPAELTGELVAALEAALS